MREPAKITSDLPAAFGTRLFAKIENWPLKICYWQLGKGFSIANDRFSIFGHGLVPKVARESEVIFARFLRLAPEQFSNTPEEDVKMGS